MLRRTMSPALLNEVANLPEVRPWVGAGDDTLDVTVLLQNPANYALVTDKGGFMLVALLPGVFELHTLFPPDARGKSFFAAAREMFRYMFTQTPCLEIITKCPDDNAGARMAAATVGFRERFRREGAWFTGGGVSYQVFSVDDWYVRDPETLRAGHDFHLALDTARAERGVAQVSHPEDTAHDQAVGASVLMVQGGFLEKGVAFYNRWAVFAGYAQISIAGPALVDIQDGLVAIHRDGVEVLYLR